MDNADEKLIAAFAIGFRYDNTNLGYRAVRELIENHQNILAYLHPKDREWYGFPPQYTPTKPMAETLELEQRSPETPSVTTDMAVARASQEVQAAMVIAKRFPRNETAALTRILTACKRRALAECSAYSYQRGDTTVVGPTIRLAEMLAQNWGNLDFGIIELERKVGESTVMAYAWDLETNTRQTKIFSVKHTRTSKKGGVKQTYVLDDPRDIYEMVANQGARRLRTCILGVIPGDIVDAAIVECENTLKKAGGEPLIDRVRKMVAAFNEIGVYQQMIETRFKHKIEITTEQEFVQMRRIYTAIKDGMGKREDYFTVEGSQVSETGTEADEKAEADAGLAPERKATAKRETKPKTEPTPPSTGGRAEPPPGDPAQKPAETKVANTPTEQSRLADYVTSLGFTFDHFRKWAAVNNIVPDVDSMASFDEVPADIAKRIMRAKVGLEQGLVRENPDVKGNA